MNALRRVARVSRRLVRRGLRAPVARDLVRVWRTVWRLGRRLSCSCCGLRFRSFEPYKGRVDARCPWCGSLERHRLIALYIRRRTQFLTGPLSLLHVAPEESLERVLRRSSELDYVSVDLHSPRAQLHMDLTDLQFPDERFDGILCSHVLEHIIDDEKAMRELHRVLKPSGVALILVPQQQSLETTYEDPSITSPEGRLAAFGQRDHVRLYGRDFVDRLTRSGFHVEPERYAETLPDAVLARYAILPTTIYRCTRMDSPPGDR